MSCSRASTCPNPTLESQNPPCSWSFLTAKENIEHRVDLHLWGWSYNKTLQIDRDSTIESEINSTALPSTRSLQHRANQDMSFDHSEVTSVNKSYNGHTLIKVLSNGTFFPERGRDEEFWWLELLGCSWVIVISSDHLWMFALIAPWVIFSVSSEV